jgi:hypothetical protein
LPFISTSERLIDVISLFLGEFLLAFAGLELCFFARAGDVIISAASRPTTADPIAEIMVAIEYKWINEKCDKPQKKNKDHPMPA